MSRQQQYLIIGAMVLLITLTKPTKTMGATSYLGRADLPRGMRNNNPGNLRISSSQWRGKIPVAQNTDGDFEQFTEYRFGVRAMIKLIQNYIAQGHNTLTKIITRYAPASENDTQAYIRAVSQATNISPYVVIQPQKSILGPVVQAMAKHENGFSTITNQEFNEAWQIL